MSAEAEAARPTLTARERRSVLLTLCLTEIVSWGVLYYAFAALQSSITTDTGWSSVAVTVGTGCLAALSMTAT